MRPSIRPSPCKGFLFSNPFNFILSKPHKGVSEEPCQHIRRAGRQSQPGFAFALRRCRWEIPGDGVQREHGPGRLGPTAQTPPMLTGISQENVGSAPRVIQHSGQRPHRRRCDMQYGRSPRDDALNSCHRVAASVSGSRCTAHATVHTRPETPARRDGRSIEAIMLTHGSTSTTDATRR